MHRQDELAGRAAEATGATAVTLARVDRARDIAACVGFSLRPPVLGERTLRNLAGAVPGYRPDRWVLPLSLSDNCRAAFTGGEVLVWPFGRIAAGQRDSPALDVFRDVAGFRYTVHAPVRVGRTLAGALDFEFTHRPRPADVRRATAIAALAGPLLRQDRRVSALQARVGALRDAERRAAAAEERVRAEVAELLHGRVQGRLLLAADRVRQAQAALGTDPARAAAMLDAVFEDLDRLREVEVRAASHRLHPAVLGAGLVPALAVLAERFGPSVRVALDVMPTASAVDVPAESRLAAYRVAEEALANVVRHAGARSCEILVGAGRRWLYVEVRDEGRGFDPAATPMGLGLLAARDRILGLGGTLQVTSAPGRGTRVAVRLPLS